MEAGAGFVVAEKALPDPGKIKWTLEIMQKGDRCVTLLGTGEWGILPDCPHSPCSGYFLVLFNTSYEEAKPPNTFVSFTADAPRRTNTEWLTCSWC